MPAFKFIFCFIAALALTACSDSFLRAMDEVNAGMGGQRTCTREAPYKTDRYQGYSYKTGGLCNIWQGQLTNYSKYTVRCDNTIGGRRANSITARPGQTTELRQIGHMGTGDLQYNCKNWARTPYVWKNYPNRNYQIFMKMSSGELYVSIKNNSYSSKRCYLKNSRKVTIVEGKVSQGGMLRWVRAPKSRVYSNCVRA